MFEIIRFTPNDADTLTWIWRETFQQAYADVHAPADLDTYCAANFSLNQAVARLNDPKSLCYGGYVKGQIAGYYRVDIAACPYPLTAPSAELKQIYILSAHYGAGIGRALYDHALESLRAEGIAAVWLAVSDINYRAQAFYAKLGFQAKGKGPSFQVGKDTLTSQILARLI